MSVGINATGQVSVTTTAVKIISANNNRSGLVLYNSGTVTVYLGTIQSTLTSGTGHALPAGAALTLQADGDIFGITASSSATVTYLEQVGQ
jgi:hypothetical protein